ncbi:MAG: hypothetical protein E6899_04770 [Neisseria sp.]|nr:hypothetical protein [Neisseria sp.]
MVGGCGRAGSVSGIGKGSSEKAEEAFSDDLFVYSGLTLNQYGVASP